MNDRAIIFYDGSCGLCHGIVQFVLRRDSQKRFDFSPLGGEAFKKLDSAEKLALLPDSFFVLDNDGKIYLKAFGLKIIFDKLGGIYKSLNTVFSVFSWSFRNYCYDFIAGRRKSFFARKESSCPVLPPDLAERFLA